MPYQDLEVGSTNTSDSGSGSGSGFSWGGFLEGLYTNYQDRKDRKNEIDAAQDFADKTKFDPYNITSPVGSVAFDDGSGVSKFSPEMQAIFDDLFDQYTNYSDRLKSYDADASHQALNDKSYNLLRPQQNQERLARENRLRSQGMLYSKGGSGHLSDVDAQHDAQNLAVDISNWDKVRADENSLLTGQTQTLTDIFNMGNQLSGLFNTGGNLGSSASSANYNAYADLEAAKAAPGVKWGGFNNNSNNPHAIDINNLGKAWDSFVGLFTPEEKKTTTPSTITTNTNRVDDGVYGL